MSAAAKKDQVPLRPAVEADREWVLRLFRVERAILGEVGSSVWYRWRTGGAHNEHWTVAEPELGFCHWRLRRDGWATIYEMAVWPWARGLGVGRALVESLGPRVRLKTDVWSEANKFYLALGFRLAGSAKSRDGARLLNIYELSEESRGGRTA